MTDVEAWGPPNHAAHTAGAVQTVDTPLRKPSPARPAVKPPRLSTADEQGDALRSVAVAMGPGWTVSAFEDMARFRLGLQGRHRCGFVVEATIGDHEGGTTWRQRLWFLASRLFDKETRHSCDAIAARRSA